MGFLAVFLCGCAAFCPRGLTVNAGAPVYYVDDKGQRFEARYCSLSDGSLRFVQVLTPDGRRFTLPETSSPSGVRYTDDRRMVWWDHQRMVSVEVRDAQGRWVTRYPELREVRPWPAPWRP